MTLTVPQIKRRIQELQATRHYGTVTLKFEDGKIIHADVHHSIKIVEEHKE